QPPTFWGVNNDHLPRSAAVPAYKDAESVIFLKRRKFIALAPGNQLFKESFRQSLVCCLSKLVFGMLVIWRARPVARVGSLCTVFIDGHQLSRRGRSTGIQPSNRILIQLAGQSDSFHQGPTSLAGQPIIRKLLFDKKAVDILKRKLIKPCGRSNSLSALAVCNFFQYETRYSVKIAGYSRHRPYLERHTAESDRQGR